MFYIDSHSFLILVELLSGHYLNTRVPKVTVFSAVAAPSFFSRMVCHSGEAIGVVSSLTAPRE